MTNIPLNGKAPFYKRFTYEWDYDLSATYTCEKHTTLSMIFIITYYLELQSATVTP
jgi:hypothetical protein